MVHRCVARYDIAPPLPSALFVLSGLRFSGFTLLIFLLFTAFYVWQIVSFVLDVIRLVDMFNFYTHLLHIPDVRLFSRISIPLLTHGRLGRYPDNFVARGRSPRWGYS